VVHAPVFDEVVTARPSVDRGFGYVTAAAGDLPLEEVSLHADIAGLAASVDLRATFYNDRSSPLEATYVFPLPELGSVCSLQIRTGATVIDGWLLERAEARDTYAAGILDKDKAAILEQEREDIVTIRVGTIAPGERVSVQLTLSTRLSYSDGEIFFRFPLVVAPRHVPGKPMASGQVGTGTAADTHVVPDASRISPPAQRGIGARLSLSIDLATDAYTIDEIGCTLRTRITDSESGKSQRIEALPGQPLDRDLVLRIRTTANTQPALTLLTSLDGDGQEGTFALTVLPPTLEQLPSGARDVVVVVDTSASMSGWRISAARRAAAQIIDSLAPADRFTVLLFADTVIEPGWGVTDLVAATERNRFRAIEHLIATPARGNPRLLPALRAAARLLTDSGRPSILAVITGGQVGNEDQIASTFTPGARVHTIGIGAAVNTGLLRRLAVAGRGEMLLAETEDALDDLVPSLRRLLGPAFLTDLNLGGDGVQLLPNSMSPSRLPDIFSGIAVVITGRFRGRPDGSVMVSGTGIDGRPWASRVNALPVDGRALTQLWARAFLADLQHKYLRCPIEQAAGLEQLIVTTSLRFGVLTRLTAFVAVSNAPTRAPGAPRQVIQSVELPADWTEPALSLSPYAIEYERILAATHNSPVARPTASTPIPDAQAAQPTLVGTGPMAAGPALSATGSRPLPAPPMIRPSSPGPMTTQPAQPAPQPPQPPPPPAKKTGSRAGRYIGAGAAAIAVATGVGLFEATTLEHGGVTASPPTTHPSETPTVHNSAPTPWATTSPGTVIEGPGPPANTQSPPIRSATAVDPGTGARLAVTIATQSDGSQVTAQVSSIPVGSHVRLVVIGRDGTRHQISEWLIDQGTSVRVAATSLKPDEIGFVAIEDQSGHTYVSAGLQ
jgi:Ca-activated chloride channel homolog